ncbi:MAG: FkbM family methyltransferase [Gammaproteobacteria bacterium]|nr:FkbM family methyltransferase [Gammaproteobacteria bacterium]
MHPARHRSYGERARGWLARTFDWRLVRWLRLGEAQQAWYLRRLLPLLQVDLVIDAGANVGQFADLLRRRAGYRGALLSVEPMPAAARQLRARFAGDAHWALAECALGDHEGRDTLHVMRGHELSSLLVPSMAATDRFETFQAIEDEVDVELRTVDALLEEHPIARHARRIYLKLDVQGTELAVLRGAARSLPRIDALQVEACVVPLYDGVPPYHALMAEIESRGYQLSFLPAHNYTQMPDMVDFDAHFVARRRLVELGYLKPGGPA